MGLILMEGLVLVRAGSNFRSPDWLVDGFHGKLCFWLLAAESYVAIPSQFVEKPLFTTMTSFKNSSQMNIRTKNHDSFSPIC